VTLTPKIADPRLVFEWSDVHLNIISHRLEELVQTDAGLVCDVMFRHLSHTQALLVLNCPAVIAVAHHRLICPALRTSTRCVRSSSVLSTLSYYTRGPGTGARSQVSDPQVDLFNIQGLRYAEDNDNVKLAERDAAFEVIPGGR
jgi:hypothetical protein